MKPVYWGSWPEYFVILRWSVLASQEIGIEQSIQGRRIRRPDSRPATHMVLELCVQQMERYSAEYWRNEPVAIIFSRQDEYAKRAEEIWRTYKGNGLWEHIVTFAYGDPEIAEFQTADMIAHETFQCLKQGGDEAWNKWPLVRQLITSDRMRGRHQTEEQFVKMMREQDINRKYLKTVEKSKPSKKA